MDAKKHRRALIANIRKFWDSAETHLDWCIERNPPGKDSRLFHVETVIEYLEDMLRSAKALK